MLHNIAINKYTFNLRFWISVLIAVRSASIASCSSFFSWFF